MYFLGYCSGDFQLATHLDDDAVFERLSNEPTLRQGRCAFFITEMFQVD